MDELQLLLNKNKLHILLIKVMHDINKGNAPKSKLEALETLKIAMDTINELAEYKSIDPKLNIEQVHFFPLGGIKKTADWVAQSTSQDSL